MIIYIVITNENAVSFAKHRETIFAVNSVYKEWMVVNVHLYTYAG